MPESFFVLRFEYTLKHGLTNTVLISSILKVITANSWHQPPSEDWRILHRMHDERGVGPLEIARITVPEKYFVVGSSGDK